MVERRTVRVWTYAAAGIVGGTALFYLPILLFGHPAKHAFPDPARIVEIVVAAILAAAWGMAFAVLAFRNADEFKQEGSRVSWYWGSLIGIAGSVPIYAFILFGGLHWLWPSSPVGKELALAFASGYALPVIMQLMGFVVVSAWWQLSKR